MLRFHHAEVSSIPTEEGLGMAYHSCKVSTHIGEDELVELELWVHPCDHNKWQVPSSFRQIEGELPNSESTGAWPEVTIEY